MRNSKAFTMMAEATGVMESAGHNNNPDLSKLAWVVVDLCNRVSELEKRLNGQQSEPDTSATKPAIIATS